MWNWLSGVLLALAVVGSSHAADRPVQKDIWKITLGTPVSEMSNADYQEYACGTNGGPPSKPIAGWEEFAKCPADERGLHEVYFRYDDEGEYRARANRHVSVLHLYEGTRAFGYHVITSVLISADGTVAGIRLVTDPRADEVERSRAWTMRRFAKARYGSKEWNCIDLPKEDRDEPVGTRYIREVCEKMYRDDTLAIVTTHLRRKPGQVNIDPRTGKRNEGYFESFTRLELLYQPALQKG